MGKSSMYSYRLEAWTSATRHDVIAWQRHHGRPTGESIARFVAAYETSEKPGGCNAHVAKQCGPTRYLVAYIVDQRTKRTVSVWFRPGDAEAAALAHAMARQAAECGDASFAMALERANRRASTPDPAVSSYVAEGLGENIDHCPSDNG